jgi:carboxypeptidase family protein
MGNKNSLLIVAGLIFQGVLSHALYAQEPCAGIMGRITTEDGALVPGVIITIRSKDTKKTESAKTDSEGQYALCLPPGLYDVLINEAAFRRAERKKIKVTQSGRPTVDFVLKLGNPIKVDLDHP